MYFYYKLKMNLPSIAKSREILLKGVHLKVNKYDEVIVMHQAMLLLILDTVKMVFPSEEVFYQHYLGISKQEWDEWKKGRAPLANDVMQKVKGLFSDYEWMLMQKVAEQAVFFPEKRHYVVPEYRRLKTMIAKQWVELPLCSIELVSKVDQTNFNELINLKISLRYGEWGYDDILNFMMPAHISKTIEGSNKGLLEWVSKDLTDIYVKSEDENKE